MSTNTPVIVVTGATGQQGAVVRHLRRGFGGFAVRALTRNPEKPTAAAPSR